MSVQALTAVFALGDDVSGAHRLVLLSLANHASSRTAECWPSHELIAEEAAVTVDTVKRCLRDLIHRGLVHRTVNAAPDDRIPDGRRPNLYRLTFVEHPDANWAGAGVPVGQPKGGTFAPPHGRRSTRARGGDPREKGGRGSPPKPSEPSKNPDSGPVPLFDPDPNATRLDDETHAAAETGLTAARRRLDRGGHL